MDVSLSGWFVILLAVSAANLPFVNERVLGLIPIDTLINSFRYMRSAVGSKISFLRKRPSLDTAAVLYSNKPFWLRLLELIVLYFLVGGIAFLLESRIGNAFSQRWEFYAITACLFLVLAFPGFVYRYLRRRQH